MLMLRSSSIITEADKAVSNHFVCVMALKICFHLIKEMMGAFING